MQDVITRPAVQAILTADTLIEHYVRAVDAVRSALGRDDVEMSAQIGDANRTYPSIWEQLDRARELLAAEGRDLAAYDDVRAAAGQTALGIDTDRSEIRDGYDLFNGYYREQTLTVHFNLRGVSLAHQASGVLKQTMSEVDWEAIGRAQAAPVADLTSGSQRKWIIAGALALVAVIALVLLLR
jgi:hypothetical protein